MKKPGRPREEKSTVINVKVDKLHVIKKILGREVAKNQTPTVRVRVPLSKLEEIKNELDS